MLGARLFLACLAFAAGPDASSTEGPTPPSTPAESNPTPDPIDPDELFVTEVAMGSSIGIGVLNPSRLDRAWTDNGFPGYGPLMWTPFAVNGELWIGRNVPAFDFIQYTQARPDRVSGGARTQLRTQLVELSYGYALVHRKGFSVVPRLGFGIYEVQNRVAADTTVQIDELADLPAGAWVLEKGAMAADLGAGLSYLIAFGSRSKLGLATGLRVGLRFGGLVQMFDFGPQGDAWRVEGSRVQGAPDMRLDTFYLRLFVAPSLLHRSRTIDG